MGGILSPYFSMACVLAVESGANPVASSASALVKGLSLLHRHRGHGGGVIEGTYAMSVAPTLQH